MQRENQTSPVVNAVATLIATIQANSISVKSNPR